MKHTVINGIEFETFTPIQTVVKKVIVNPLINYLVPPAFLKFVFRTSKSDLAKESLIAPGNWNSMKISYENKPPKDFIDKLVLRYGSFPVGLRNRKKLVVSKMTQLIKNYKDKDKIIIVGIGSARACNALEAMKLSGISTVEGYFVDIDNAAMSAGKELAHSLGLDDKAHYIKGNAIHLKKFIPGRADILKLIGIIEYLTDAQIKEILKAGFENLSQGGSIITHSIQPTHGIDPFLRKVFNLNLIYRTPGQVKSLLEEAGFTITEEDEEPLGIYTIVIGTKQKPVSVLSKDEISDKTASSKK